VRQRNRSFLRRLTVDIIQGLNIGSNEWWYEGFEMGIQDLWILLKRFDLMILGYALPAGINSVPRYRLCASTPLGPGRSCACAAGAAEDG
jgi:hypothetical protein